MGSATPLERELNYFQAQKERLLEHHEGAFVLISGEELVGAFTTQAEAYEAGLKQLGNIPFLIHRVTRAEEEIQFPALVVGIIRGAHA